MHGNLDELLKDIPPEVARGVARYGVRIAIDLLQTLYRDLGGEREGKSEWSATRKLAREIRGQGGATLKVRKKQSRSGWPDDPAARSREMKRRMALSKKKAAQAGRIAGAKKRWNNMTVRQRKEWLAGMQRGRQQQRDKTEAKVA